MFVMPTWVVVVWSVVALLALGLVALSFFTVETQTVKIVERFGKYLRTAEPGLGMCLPLIDQVDEVDLRLRQLQIALQSKTEDNVFVKLHFSIQYQVIPEKVFDAYYKLEDEEAQINAYVANSVRSRVPHLTLALLYSTDAQIANEVRSALETVMEGYGYTIESTLLTAIEPDAKVQASLNDIQAATNEKTAAEQRAEAKRIIVVKQAEAEAEAKKLAGKGVADQRTQIVEGLRANVKELAGQEGIGIDTQEVMSLLLLSQYFDMLHALAATGPTTILLPHTPGALGDLKAQLTQALLGAQAAGAVPGAAK